MVKHTQTIRRLLQTNCLGVFDHFVGLAHKQLKVDTHKRFYWIFLSISNHHSMFYLELIFKSCYGVFQITLAQVLYGFTVNELS